MIRLSDDLLTWRAVYRLNQTEAAYLLGVSVRQLGRWERGEAYPKEDNYNNVRWLIAQPPYGRRTDIPEPAE